MERRVTNLAKKICKEHLQISSNGSSTHYLWFMYVDGTKEGNYKPFIFLAELHLLEYLGFMDESSVDNAVKLLQSPDRDNLFIASQVINFFRKERIKKLGEFDLKKSKYREVVRDYDSKIVNVKVWRNKKKLEKNE